jgi:uncharacterized membrane protein
MAFCANCGSEVAGRFCAKCGTAVAAASADAGGAAPPPPSSSYSPPPNYPAPNYPSQTAAQPGLQENVAAALCYLLGVLSGVLFLVLEPYNRNRNIRFHAFQSIFLWLAIVAAAIAFGILAAIISFIPFIGVIALMVWPIFWLGTIVVWVMMLYKTYNNQRVVLPVIGPLAEKQA